MFQSSGFIKKITKYLVIVTAMVCGLWFAIGCSKDAEIFDIVFSAGIGEGTPPASQRVESGKKIYLPGQEEMTAPENKKFVGWKAEGETVLHEKDGAYVVTGDVRFVAQWSADFKVSFSVGEGSGTKIATQEVEKGEVIYLPGQEEMTAPERKVFDGWKDAADATGKIYEKDDAYTVNGDVHFVAQWRAGDKFKASFSVGEGSGTKIASQEVKKGEVIYLPGQEEMKAPDWKVFAGWKDAADAEGKIYNKDDAYTVNGDVHFVAQWETEIAGYSEALLPALPNVADKGLLIFTAEEHNFINISVKKAMKEVDDGEGGKKSVQIIDTVKEYMPCNSYGYSSECYVNGEWVYYDRLEKEYSPCGAYECHISGKTEFYTDGTELIDGEYVPFRYKLDEDDNRIRYRLIITPRMDSAFVRDTVKFAKKTVTAGNLPEFVQSVRAALYGGDTRSRSLKETWTTTQKDKDSTAGTLMMFNALGDSMPAAAAAVVPAFTGRYSSYVLWESTRTQKQNLSDTYYENVVTKTGTIQYVNFSQSDGLSPTGRAKASGALFFGGAVGIASCDYNYQYADIKELADGGLTPALITTKKGDRGSVNETKSNGTVQFSGAYAGTISFNNVYVRYRSKNSPEVSASSRYAEEVGGEVVIKSGTAEIKLNIETDEYASVLAELLGGLDF